MSDPFWTWLFALFDSPWMAAIAIALASTFMVLAINAAGRS